MKNTEISNKIKNKPFLNEQIIINFREIINSSPIFRMHNKYKGGWNLICAVMDRVTSCVDYLNKTNSNYPNSEEEFIVFLTFSCMLKDAVLNLFEQLGITYPYGKENNKEVNKRFFGEVNEKNPYLQKNLNSLKMHKYPIDDEFFHYFRSLAFAHPYETSRHSNSGLIQKGEIQYSPWVIANKDISRIYGENDLVGVRIYSNILEDIFDLTFTFELLKRYIKSRYELIIKASKWAKNEIELKNKKWKDQKINRDKSHIDILKDINDILKDRFIDELYEIDDAINLLQYEVNGENKEIVDKYKNHVKSKIDFLCDAVESLDENHKGYSEFSDAVKSYPKKVYSSFHYQMEKIFACLPDNPELPKNDYWYKNVRSFENRFGKGYVTIDTENMSMTEIKLLIRAACYNEKINQESGLLHPSCIESTKNSQGVEIEIDHKFKNKDFDFDIKIIDPSY